MMTTVERRVRAADWRFATAGLLALAVSSATAHVADGTAGAQAVAAAHECFIVAPPGESERASDARECAHKTAPASTFKIPHALIALQAGVVTPDTVFKWDGSERPFDTWKRDHTLESAIRWSVYPFFQHTARLLGRERMRQGLTSLQYGGGSFNGELTEFWNTGGIVVSPLEQVAFLQRVTSGKVPIDPRHVDAVREALRMPAGQITNAAGTHSFALDWPPGTVVRAKTGNTTVNGERVSWLVGWIEHDRAVTVFAGRIRSTSPLENTAGAEVARRGLNDAWRTRK